MGFDDRLLPAPRNGGFAMDGYWVWCGSVVRGEDGRYHMFASRWPRSLPFFDGYLQASEVVRAVADRPTGPYRFEGIVLPARGPRFWDGMMTHNPTVRWDDGGTSEQGHLERPHLLVENGIPTHLCLATGDGPAGFEAVRKTLMTRTWDPVIPRRPPAAPAAATRGPA